MGRLQAACGEGGGFLDLGSKSQVRVARQVDPQGAGPRRRSQRACVRAHLRGSHGCNRVLRGKQCPWASLLMPDSLLGLAMLDPLKTQQKDHRKMLPFFREKGPPQ